MVKCVFRHCRKPSQQYPERSCQFNQNIGSWNTAAVAGMSYMFNGASAFNQDIGNWDTTAATNMSNMFNGASAFNQDLSVWCVSGISSEPTDFATGANAFSALNKPVWGSSCGPQLSLHSNGKTIVAADNAVVGKTYTLNGVDYLVVDNSTIAANKTLNIVTTRVTNMTDLFKSTSFNSDIGHWDTSTVTVTHGMFEGNTSFNQDISSWNTAALVDSSYMFSGATAFNQNYTSSWNTAAVTNNSYMFTLPPPGNFTFQWCDNRRIGRCCCRAILYFKRHIIFSSGQLNYRS